MDQLSFIPREKKVEYVAWPVRFPFTALINGVERVYREMPKVKPKWRPPFRGLDDEWLERVEREP